MNNDRGSWEAPRITPLEFNQLNKFGSRRVASDRLDEIDGASIAEMAAKHGSPLFVASESRLRSNARRLRSMFETRGVHAIHGWSYKTNYTSAICNVFHQEGSWAEVVSQFEYDKARRLGVPGNKIIFNGPNKTRKALERALDEGARIHADHFDEIDMVEDIASRRGVVASLAIRINFDTGYSEPWSRFGFNLESGQAMEACARIKASPNLRLSGLHNHIGTFILDPRAYGSQMKIMCGFMEKLEDMGFESLEYLDIGGGFPSKNALHGIYLPPEQSVPDLEEYAEAICSGYKRHSGYRLAAGKARPELVFECGRAAVDDAVTLIASVAARKPLPSGAAGIVLDAGVNVLFTAFWYSHAVKAVGIPRGAPQETVLYGPMCMNIDVVRASVQLPPLEPGDLVAISPAGAYNNTQWMQFIEYRPAIVMVCEDGKVETIREAENLDSMCFHDRLPVRLSNPSMGTASAMAAVDLKDMILIAEEE